MRIAFDWQHGLLTAGSAIAGALVGYLDSQGPKNIIAALGSWESAKPMAIGAAVAALGALITLAKASYLVPAPGNPTTEKLFRGPSPLSGVGPILLALGVSGAALAAVNLSACDAFRAAAPDIARLIDVILADVQAGKSFAQIVADCEGASAQLIADLIAALIDDPHTPPTLLPALHQHLASARMAAQAAHEAAP